MKGEDGCFSRRSGLIGRPEVSLSSTVKVLAFPLLPEIWRSDFMPSFVRSIDVSVVGLFLAALLPFDCSPFFHQQLPYPPQVPPP